MSKIKSRLTAAVTAFTLAGTIAAVSVLGGSSASAANQPERQATSYITNTQGVVTNWHLGKGIVYGDNLGPGIADWFLTTPQNSITTGMLKPNVVTEDKLSAALREKINATDPEGPAYLANWGTIFRNTTGNGSAELGQSSAGEGLTINTPAATDMATFGNEKDFAGKPVELTAVKYEVFTTGENIAKSASGNMPSIKIEITNPAGTETYTTLVYAPGNSDANTWTEIDAKADTGKHWGFTRPYFNGAEMNERCGINGTRCTLAEALAVLGDQAKLMSVAIGKGRDHEFHGAVRSLTINGDTFEFGKAGVTK